MIFVLFPIFIYICGLEKECEKDDEKDCRFLLLGACVVDDTGGAYTA